MKRNDLLRTCRFGGIILLGGLLMGCGHNPNHDIDENRARAAADRVIPPPDPETRAKMGPGHGG